jgi:hypothetical protein
MRQVIAAGVSPLPMFDILTVPFGQADGCYLIAVPRSPMAPHAVLVNDALRFPRRNGATTRHLSEAEVAAAYRDRVTRLQDQKARLDDLAREARSRLDDSYPWILVSLVPDVPGGFDIDRQAQLAFEESTRSRGASEVFGSVTFLHTRLGRRRLLAEGGRRNGRVAYASAEFHLDGSGTHALELFGVRVRPDDDGAMVVGASDPTAIEDDEVVTGVWAGLQKLAVHARDRAATGGSAVVAAQIVPDHRGKTMIRHRRRHLVEQTRGRAVHGDPWTAETVASIDELATPGPLLVAAAARLVDEIGQEFDIAEMGQATRDGDIRIRSWKPELQRPVRSWAERHGITVTDQELA